MFESNFREVREPDPRFPVRGSIPPFVRRSLIHVYHGRFCFKMPGVRCGPQKTIWSRTIGQEEELSLSPSAQGISIGSFTKRHTHTESLTWEIGPGASVSPVWYYEDSELHVYESSSYVRPHLFRRRSKVFLPADCGDFDGNFLDPDPECRRRRSGAPSVSGPPPPAPPEVAPQVTQLVEPVAFSRPEGDDEGHDPAETVAAAAQILTEDLVPAAELRDPGREDWYRPGLVAPGGSIAWLDAEPKSHPENLVPASAGCLARDRGSISLSPEERDRPFPVLAFAGGTGAERMELGVLAEGEGGSGEIWSGDGVVREDDLELPGLPGRIALTTAWGHADLSSLPDGVSGTIHGRAFDSSGELVAKLALPFTTEERPEPVTVEVRELARAN